MTQSHLEAVRFIWMSCGARGRLHFTSLILENLNKRAALYVHQRCEKEVIRPGRIPRAVKSQGAWRRHHRHCPPTRCLVATTMSMANNRHLLNTNCVHLPWHEQSENVSPRAPGYAGSASSPTCAHTGRLCLVSLFQPKLPL